MEYAVGPVLNICGEVHGVISAIQDDNPGIVVEVIDRGGYLRVQASNTLTVTRESLQRHLGPSFELHSFESMMSAFSGRIRTSPEQITWYLRTGTDGRVR
jgi:toluene monooxygenase system protein D